jgi:hypothetical protein
MRSPASISPWSTTTSTAEQSAARVDRAPGAHRSRRQGTGACNSTARSRGEVAVGRSHRHSLSRTASAPAHLAAIAAGGNGSLASQLDVLHFINARRLALPKAPSRLICRGYMFLIGRCTNWCRSSALGCGRSLRRPDKAKQWLDEMAARRAVFSLANNIAEQHPAFTVELLELQLVVAAVVCWSGIDLDAGQ